jgi:hypothetical protein
MAWPKKGTRELVINDQKYLWHYDAHCPLCSSKVFTVGQEGKSFVLFIDPYPWGFELRPASVVSAIKWALKKNWSPESGPTRSMAWNDDSQMFEWLPDGERHLSCKSKPISKEQAIKKYGPWDGLNERDSLTNK